MGKTWQSHLTEVLYGTCCTVYSDSEIWSTTVRYPLLPRDDGIYIEYVDIRLSSRQDDDAYSLIASSPTQRF